jgi:pimeloyl-ACP methyl ester carboxylesterase
VETLELAQHLGDRGAGNGDLALPAGQLSEWWTEANDSHFGSLSGGPKFERRGVVDVDRRAHHGDQPLPSEVAIEFPENRWTDLDGPIHYVEWDGPADRTFVLVHGLGGSVLSWAAVGPGLAKLGRALAMDFPGFGRSPNARRRSRVSDNRAILARFIDEHAGGGPVVLCGNSMGGGIAMLQAALEPETVAALVLSNSVFPWVWGAVPAPIVMTGFGLYRIPRVGEWFSRRRLTALEAETAVRVGLRIVAADPGRIDPDLVQAHVDQLRRQESSEDAGAAFLEAARSLMALGRRRAAGRWILDSVRCPVLVIHGRADRLVPVRFAEHALAGHPDWTMRLLPKVGHVPQMEAPERWLDAVGSWVAELSAAGEARARS